MSGEGETVQVVAEEDHRSWSAWGSSVPSDRWSWVGAEVATRGDDAVRQTHKALLR